MTNPKTQNASGEGGVPVDLAGGREATNQKNQTKSSTDSNILKNKSTANEVQIAKVLALLRHGPKTTFDLQRHAIMMPAARVFQLKNEQNYTITTERLALYDNEGVRHSNCARYHLIELPAVQTAFDFGGAQ